MLYALQTASANLRIADFEVEEASDVVVDRDTVNATCLNGPQWFEEDFEDRTGADEEAGEEEAEDGEEEAEHTTAAEQATSDSAPEKPAEVKQVSMEEARTQVKEVVRDWILQTTGQEPREVKM